MYFEEENRRVAFPLMWVESGIMWAGVPLYLFLAGQRLKPPQSKQSPPSRAIFPAKV